MQFLLGVEDEDEEHTPHDIFTEMDEICVKDGEDPVWRESARYNTHEVVSTHICVYFLKMVIECSGRGLLVIPLTLMKALCISITLSNFNSILVIAHRPLLSFLSLTVVGGQYKQLMPF